MSQRSEHHYVSILKGKKGEFDALALVAAADKPRMTPLIEIFTVPWDWNNDTPAKAIEAHLDSAVAQLVGGWGIDQAAWIDTLWLDADVTAGGKTPLEYVFDQCRVSNLAALPVGGPGRPASHTTSVAAVHAADQRGVVLRLDPEDLGDPGALMASVTTWLQAVGVAPAEVDLMVDFSAITPALTAGIQLAASAIVPTLPYLQDWRTFTLASGGFPADLSAVKAQSVQRLPRCDWTMWQTVSGRALPRMPAFGDYAISHPELSDPDPRTMRASATIRYTADDVWVVVKERWLRYGYDQFRQASSRLKAQPEWAAATHCPGCEFIDACAAGGSTTGNLTVWRRVGTVHHLTHTVAQLASLP
jgi:hypothetical protein